MRSCHCKGSGHHVPGLISLSRLATCHLDKYGNGDAGHTTSSGSRRPKSIYLRPLIIRFFDCIFLPIEGCISGSVIANRTRSVESTSEGDAHSKITSMQLLTKHLLPMKCRRSTNK